MSAIRVQQDKKGTLDRTQAMTPELMEANRRWNTFVERNRGWILEYRKRMQNITEDKITVDSVIKERLQECFEDNQPLSGEFLRLRKALMEPQALGKYKKNLDRMTQLDAPVPYYRSLILDPDAIEEVDFMKRKLGHI